MSAAERKRLDAIDVARGVALVAMAGYHFTWDLAYFSLVPATTPFTIPMRVASHSIGSAFLALAGVSLALAHGHGFRGRSYLKRLARIGVAAALVTAATYAVAPDSLIGFGILHCIFVGSLLAAVFLIVGRSPSPQRPGRGEARFGVIDGQPIPSPLVGEGEGGGSVLLGRSFPDSATLEDTARPAAPQQRGQEITALVAASVLAQLPLSSEATPVPSPPPQGGRESAAPAALTTRGVSALGVGMALILLPFLVSSPLFDPPWLVWLGLGTQEPPTLDWRPLMPWGGVLLLGLGAAMLAPIPFASWRAGSAPARWLGFAGRHSLAIYLIHQPVLLGLLYGATELSGFNQKHSVEAYLKACRPACVEAGGEADSCERACACVVRDASGAGLADRLGALTLSKAERARIGSIVESCSAQVK